MWRGARSCKTTWIPRAAEVCRLRKYRRRGATRFLRPYNNHNNNNNNSHNIVIIYVYCILLLYAMRVHRAHNNEYNNNNNNTVRLVCYYYYKIEQSAVVFWRNYYIGTVTVGGVGAFLAMAFFARMLPASGRSFVRYCTMSRTCNVNVVTNNVFGIILQCYLCDRVRWCGRWRFVEPLKIPINNKVDIKY